TLSHLPNGYEIVDGKGTTLLFNSDGKLYKIQQKVGASQYVSTNISYQNGKISQVVDGMGTTYVWDYSAENICSIKKGSDTLCTVYYNAEQQIVQVAYPSGISSTFVYAINGLLKSVKDSSTSEMVKFDYNEMWSVVSIKQSVQKNAEEFPTKSYFLSYSMFEEDTTKQLSTTVDYCKNTFDADEKYMRKRFDFSTDGVLLFAGNPDQSGRMIVLNKEDYSSHFATLDNEPKVFMFDSLAGDVPEFAFSNTSDVPTHSTTIRTEEDALYFKTFVFATTVEVTKASVKTNERIEVSLCPHGSLEKIATIYVKPYVVGKQTIFLHVNLDTMESHEYHAYIDCKVQCSAKVHNVSLYKVKQNPKFQVVNLDTGSLDSTKVFGETPNYWYKMTNCTITCGEHVAENAKFTTKDYLLTLCSKMANANFFNVWYNDGSQCFVGVGNATFTFNNGTIRTLGNIMVADVSKQHNITNLQYATLEDDGLYVHNQVHNGTEFQQSYSKMDDLFRTVKTEDGNGVVTEYVFDAFSNVTKQSTYHKDTPSNAIKWETVHSADGKLATADKSFYLLDTHTTSYAYNADSMLQSVTEPNGQEYSYTYDTDKTQQVKVESTLDNQTHQTGVNLQSGVCQSMYDSNNTYYFGYDQRNNVSTVSTNGVTLLSKQHTYLPTGGEQILSTFANGYKQRNTYNSFGKLILAEDVTNATAVPLVAYIYSDLALDETNIEVSSPTDSSLVVSESSKLRKVIDYASGKTSFYYYDQNGVLFYTTDGLVATSIYEKDDYNRPTKGSVVFQQERIDFAYNYKSPFDSTLIEESTETEDKTFTTTYTTDTLQRPTETQVLVGVNGYKTIYHYAPQKEQHWVEADVTRPTSEASLQYVPGDSAIGGEGYWETRNIGTTPKIASVSRYKITNGVPSNESYEEISYDANGNITQCYGTAFVYDKLNRLVRENNSTLDKTFVWCYDTSGNILSRTEYDYTIGDLTNVAPTATFAYEYESGWKDKLTSFAGQPIVYAKDIIPVLYKNMHLGWSRNGLLTTVSTTNTAIAMQYNASGVRFKKVVLGTGVYSTTDYTYAGNKLVRETKTGTLASTKTYLYNSQGIIGFVQDGVEYIYHKNIFGDIVAIYQGATKVVEYAYDAFGNCTIVSDTDGIGANNPFRYRGYYWDTDLQLYYIQGRYYDPQIGRFVRNADVSRLDASSINGLNLYALSRKTGHLYSNAIRESSSCEPLATNLRYGSHDYTVSGNTISKSDLDILVNITGGLADGFSLFNNIVQASLELKGFSKMPELDGISKSLTYMDVAIDLTADIYNNLSDTSLTKKQQLIGFAVDAAYTLASTAVAYGLSELVKAAVALIPGMAPFAPIVGTIVSIGITLTIDWLVEEYGLLDSLKEYLWSL
ncbi:MAG: RHS repeat-associated core domain-containing protein, partial [Clostridia bacterium]|nr:RHS repeat-associated core domain-containing protein [Clostridia bacterium]